MVVSNNKYIIKNKNKEICIRVLHQVSHSIYKSTTKPIDCPLFVGKTTGIRMGFASGCFRFLRSLRQKKARIYPLVMTSIAMENGPFPVNIPIQSSFSMAMLNYQLGNGVVVFYPGYNEQTPRKTGIRVLNQSLIGFAGNDFQPIYKH